MTLVDLASLFTVEGGFSPSARAVATAQYWAGNRPSVDVAGADVRFSVPIRVPLEGDPVTIDMVPTAGVRCVKWSVEDVENRRSLTRFTEIPDVPTVAFGDLVDVDPTTFEPSAEGKAAWDAAVEAAQSAVAGAVAAKDAARVSAEAAGDAADAAVPAASEAVSAASTATTAASDAGTARDEAVSAAGDAVAASVALSGAVGDVAGLKTLTTTGRLGEAELHAAFLSFESEALFPITKYGAEQGVFLTDAAMTAGSAVLTTSHAFTAADVGKVIGVHGAGPISTDYSVLANDGALVTTIASVAGGVATLATPAVNTATGMRAVFGTPIDNALRDAVDAASVNGGNILFPAGVWVAATQVKFPLGVGFTGAGKVKSRVYYVHASDGSDYNVTPWLSCTAAVDPISGKKPAVSISDFLADGTFYVGTAGYSYRAKLIIADNTVDSHVRNMAIINSPATAVGWDVSERCIIEGNTLVNAGRFAYVNNDRGGTSGSGIGVVVNGVSDDVSIVIRDNFIFGNWTSSSGTGRCGINIEGVWDDAAIPTKGSHLVTGNYIEGFFSGIRDSGALASRIIGNDVRKCQVGILAGAHSGSLNSRVPLSTVITGNVVREGVKYNISTGAAVDACGIEVSTWRTTTTPALDGRILIHGNQVFGIPGRGIYLNGNPREVVGVKVAENMVRDNEWAGITISGIVSQSSVTGNYIEKNGRQGIRLGGTLKSIVVADNEVYANCIWSGTYAVSIATGTTWAGGRIVDNTMADNGSTPTQTNQVNTESGATLTGVRIEGNTGDQAVTRLYKQTGADTTITNTTAFTAVAGASIVVEAGKTYVIEAQINYTSSAAAGAKFNWTFPAGTSAAWSLDGQGASAAVASQTGSASVAGIDGATSIAARIIGRFTVGSTAGTVQLNAAQVTPTADNLVVKSGTFIEARPTN